jgi:hypothetical protein
MRPIGMRAVDWTGIGSEPDICTSSVSPKLIIVRSICSLASSPSALRPIQA